MKSEIFDKFKFYLLLTAILLATGKGAAQEQKDIVIRYPEQYLFVDFQPSRIAMKTGRDINLLLNYSVVLEKMMFLQRGQVYEMLNYESVDTVFIQNRKFVPFEKFFLEVVLEGKMPLYIRHTGKDLGPSRPAAYGGKSDVSSSNYINYMGLTGEPFRMRNLDEVDIKYDQVYFVNTGDRMESFSSKKQLLRIFPDKKSMIKKHLRNTRVDFSDASDVIKLIGYISTGVSS